MPDVIIENPILNSPFREPTWHFKFTDEGITNEIAEGRRISSYFIPIAKPKKKGKQLTFDTEWTQDRVEENKTVNRIRQRVGLWRQGGYVGVTPITARLLQYWTDPDRENKLFFCQVEALETIVYLTEAARKVGDTWIENWLRDANDSANPGLNRVAMKMATGSGKTVVMAMLIAWHALNKLADPKDRRFSDTFLVVTPGITIRDRLRVPNSGPQVVRFQGRTSLRQKGDSHGLRTDSPSAARLHADRAVGGDRDHRGPDRPAPAGGAIGPRGGAAHPVHQQSQADRTGAAPLSRHLRCVPARGDHEFQAHRGRHLERQPDELAGADSAEDGAKSSL
jgi:type III restriction enzyme